MRAIIILVLCMAQVSCVASANSNSEHNEQPKAMQRITYINRNGDNIIDATKYRKCEPFSGGLAAVMSKDGLWGYIDHEGRSVISPRYLEARRFSEGLAAVKIRTDSSEEGLWVFIDEAGTEVFRTGVDVLYDFSGGNALAKDRNWVYLINKRGQARRLFDAQKFHLGNEDVQGFSYGLLVVGETLKRKYGFIDLNGNVVIPPKFEEAASFKQGVARVVVNNDGRPYLGYIKTDGEYLLSPRFDIDHEFTRNSRDFSEGLAGVAPIQSSTSDLPTYLFITLTGDVAFKTTTIDVGLFSDGLVLFYDMETAKYGYLDSKGRTAIKPRFSLASDFSEGLACVTSD